MQFIQLHFVNGKFCNWERSLKQCLLSTLLGCMVVCVLSVKAVSIIRPLFPAPCPNPDKALWPLAKGMDLCHKSSSVTSPVIQASQRVLQFPKAWWTWDGKWLMVTALLTRKLTSPLRNMPDVPDKVAVGPSSLYGITSKNNHHYHLPQTLKPFHICWTVREIPRIHH